MQLLHYLVHHKEPGYWFESRSSSPVISVIVALIKLMYGTCYSPFHLSCLCSPSLFHSLFMDSVWLDVCSASVSQEKKDSKEGTCCNCHSLTWHVIPSLVKQEHLSELLLSFDSVSQLQHVSSPPLWAVKWENNRVVKLSNSLLFTSMHRHRLLYGRP